MLWLDGPLPLDGWLRIVGDLVNPARVASAGSRVGFRNRAALLDEIIPYGLVDLGRLLAARRGAAGRLV